MLILASQWAGVAYIRQVMFSSTIAAMFYASVTKTKVKMNKPKLPSFALAVGKCALAAPCSELS